VTRVVKRADTGAGSHQVAERIASARNGDTRDTRRHPLQLPETWKDMVAFEVEVCERSLPIPTHMKGRRHLPKSASQISRRCDGHNQPAQSSLDCNRRCVRESRTGYKRVQGVGIVEFAVGSTWSTPSSSNYSAANVCLLDQISGTVDAVFIAVKRLKTFWTSPRPRPEKALVRSPSFQPDSERRRRYCGSARIAATCAASGIAVCGPNCLGRD